MSDTKNPSIRKAGTPDTDQSTRSSKHDRQAALRENAVQKDTSHLPHWGNIPISANYGDMVARLNGHNPQLAELLEKARQRPTLKLKAKRCEETVEADDVDHNLGISVSAGDQPSRSREAPAVIVDVDVAEYVAPTPASTSQNRSNGPSDRTQTSNCSGVDVELFDVGATSNSADNTLDSSDALTGEFAEESIDIELARIWKATFSDESSDIDSSSVFSSSTVVDDDEQAVFKSAEQEMFETARRRAQQVEAANAKFTHSDKAIVSGLSPEKNRKKGLHAGAQKDTQYQEARHQELARVEAARANAQRAETQRIKRQREEAERVEAARTEAARAEAARVEAEHLAEVQRLQALLDEEKQLEVRRAEAARAKANKIAADRAEAAQAAAREAEAARAKAKQVEADRAEAARAAARKAKAAHVEAARLEVGRAEVEQSELAASRTETDKAEAQLAKKLKVYAKRAENHIREKAKQAADVEIDRMNAASLDLKIGEFNDSELSQPLSSGNVHDDSVHAENQVFNPSLTGEVDVVWLDETSEITAVDIVLPPNTGQSLRENEDWNDDTSALDETATSPLVLDDSQFFDQSLVHLSGLQEHDFDDTAGNSISAASYVSTRRGWIVRTLNSFSKMVKSFVTRPVNWLRSRGNRKK